MRRVTRCRFAVSRACLEQWAAGTGLCPAGGYHPVRPGEKYKNGRYTVLHKLGWGHFSTVWLVHDVQTGTEAALKVGCHDSCWSGTGTSPGSVVHPFCSAVGTVAQVQKSAQHYAEAARDEITLLEELRDGDLAGARHCVRLLDSFEHSGQHGRHVCMVFEVLGDNLLVLIKEYDYRGIPIPIVQRLTQQVESCSIPLGGAFDACLKLGHLQTSLALWRWRCAGAGGPGLHAPRARHHPHRPQTRERDAVMRHTATEMDGAAAGRGAGVGTTESTRGDAAADEESEEETETEAEEGGGAR